MSDGGWLLGGPIPTTIEIAAVAAITAGLLYLTGVGNSESSEERVDSAAQELARRYLEESPEFCDQFEPAQTLRPLIAMFFLMLSW